MTNPPIVLGTHLEKRLVKLRYGASPLKFKRAVAAEAARCFEQVVVQE
jgi:hypothetical protein